MKTHSLVHWKSLSGPLVHALHWESALAEQGALYVPGKHFEVLHWVHWVCEDAYVPGLQGLQVLSEGL